VLALTVGLTAANAQLFSFGIKAGGVVTGALDSAAWSTSEAKRYTAGPMIEIHLPMRFSVEVDALYKRAGERDAACQFTYCSFSSVRANVFEFPFLLRYRLLEGPVAPYAAVGVAYRHVGKATGTALNWRSGPLVAGEVVDPTVQSFPLSNPSEDHAGIVAGGGVRFCAGRVALSPEARYTRWNGRYWEASGSRGYYTAANANQVEILMGLSF
jgi:hypothetical protein